MSKETINVKIDPEKIKSRKRHSDEISEVFKVTTTGAYSTIIDEVQDNILEKDSVMQSPVDTNMKTEMGTTENHAEGSAVQKLKGMRYSLTKEPNEPELIGLPHEFPEKCDRSSIAQTNILSTPRLVDGLCEQDNDDTTKQIQRWLQELECSAGKKLDEFEMYCSKEVVVTPSSESIQILENPEVSSKENDNSLSSHLDDVSSVELSVEGCKIIERFLVKSVSPTIHDGKNSDFTSQSDPCCSQIPEKSEICEQELEQAIDGSLVMCEDNIKMKNPLPVGVVTEDVSSSVIGKEDSPSDLSHFSPERVPVGRPRKKLLILDINGLLADIVSPLPKQFRADIVIAKRGIFKRPFFSDFLEFCFERFDVGIWSSRTMKNVDRVIDYLMGDTRQKLLFCWDISYCTDTGSRTLENKHKPLVFKEMRKIWEKHDPNFPWEKGDYNESNTLLLDDSPYKALLNPPHTGIFPYSYQFQNRGDNSLGPGGDIRVYLEELSAAENVQKYVEQHPFGQSAITESSPSWDFYHKILTTSESDSLPTTTESIPPHLPLAMENPHTMLSTSESDSLPTTTKSTPPHLPLAMENPHKMLNTSESDSLPTTTKSTPPHLPLAMEPHLPLAMENPHKMLNTSESDSLPTTTKSTPPHLPLAMEPHLPLAMENPHKMLNTSESDSLPTTTKSTPPHLPLAMENPHKMLSTSESDSLPTTTESTPPHLPLAMENPYKMLSTSESDSLPTTTESTPPHLPLAMENPVLIENDLNQKGGGGNLVWEVWKEGT